MREHAVESSRGSLYNRMLTHGGSEELAHSRTSSSGQRPSLGPTELATASYRYAIFSLLFFFIAGGLLLVRLPMRRAIEQAGNVPPERL